jgi:hypothetical protein
MCFCVLPSPLLCQANAAPNVKVLHAAAAAAATPSSAQDWWPQTQLVGLPTARVVSNNIKDVMAVAGAAQQQQGRRGGVPVPVPATDSNNSIGEWGCSPICMSWCGVTHAFYAQKVQCIGLFPADVTRV